MLYTVIKVFIFYTWDMLRVYNNIVGVRTALEVYPPLSTHVIKILLLDVILIPFLEFTVQHCTSILVNDVYALSYITTIKSIKNYTYTIHLHLEGLVCNF